MTGAREQMLEAIRDGLRHAVLPDAESDVAAAPRAVSAGTAGTADTVDAAGRELLWRQFTGVLTALTGRVHHAASAAEAAGIVMAVAAEHGARTCLSWDGDQLGCDGLLEELASRGLARVPSDLSFDAGQRAAEVPALGDVVLGLTGSDAAIADAGAIVLASGPGRGRLASLLPPVHVAIVSASRIWPSLPAMLTDEPDLVGRGANTVVIAGPSRTADIEMTLTHGVHGPKHLHVVVMP
jgi:L-lactate dehydrogenase complex protein LldG